MPGVRRRRNIDRLGQSLKRMGIFRFIGKVLAFAALSAVVASCRQNPRPGVPADARLLDEAKGVWPWENEDEGTFLIQVSFGLRSKGIKGCRRYHC